MFKFHDIIIENITAKEWKNNLLIKYNDSSLKIQTNWMKFTNFGVPLKDKFHTTEESRRYIQLPLNDDDEMFTTFLQNLDKYFASDEFKNKYLTEKQKQFTYTNIYKDRVSEKYPASFKVKMILEDNIFKTELSHIIDGNVETCIFGNMDDVKRNFPYMSDYRCIIKVSKVWFLNKTYGVKLQLEKMQIKPNSKTKNDETFID